MRSAKPSKPSKRAPKPSPSKKEPGPSVAAVALNRAAILNAELQKTRGVMWESYQLLIVVAESLNSTSKHTADVVERQAHKLLRAAHDAAEKAGV